MPLLRRHPFVRERPPPSLKPNDEVFFCKITKEIFVDYEKFFERTILCNSLIWTCAYTGHPGLTFQEALESEQKAKDQLALFSPQLKRPLLYLVTLTHRSRLNDVNDDVYLFAKDRYFIGEIVDIISGNARKSATVVSVIVGKTESGTGTNAESDGKKRFGSDPTSFKYVVKLENEATTTVDAASIGRRRHALTRERCRLLLKKHCYVDPTGIFCVKPKYKRQYELCDFTFEEVCGGTIPVFGSSVAKRKSTAKQVSDSEEDQLNDGMSSDEDGCTENVAIERAKETQQRKKETASSSLNEPKAKRPKFEKEVEKEAEEHLAAMRAKLEEKAKLKEKVKEEKLAAKLAKKDELKKKADEEREKRKQEKEKQKEEKKRHEEFLKEWNKIREDMECGDSKELPVPKPVNTCLSGDIFGQSLCVMEFMTSFKSVFDFDLPKDFSFGSLMKALSSSEVDGLFFDLVHELMSSLFQCQEDEEVNESDDDDDKTKETSEMKNKEVTGRSCRELVKLATVASQQSALSYGSPLCKLQLDSYTVSEIVRLHLLGSGCERPPVSARFDYQQRGGYSSIDDPALDVRRQESQLLTKLESSSIFDLAADEKVKILYVLTSQLLTFAVCRDHIDDCAEKLKQVQRNLRLHQLKESRRERDENQYWLRKKMDERLKDHMDGEKPGENVQNGLHAMEVSENCSFLTTQKADSGKKNLKQKKPEYSEKDYEMMPVENIDWEKISPEERQNMKEWAKRKELELMEEMCELEFSCNMAAIGRDRLFRRYWVFRSTPGLFVEDDEQNIPPDFLDPSTHGSSAVANGNLSIANSTSSDKENIAEPSVKQETSENLLNVSKLETDEAPAENSSADGVNQDRQPVKVCETDEATKSIPNTPVKMETEIADINENTTSTPELANNQSSVDGGEQKANRNVMRWSLFTQPCDIDLLIETLNPRGTRESRLRQVISEQRDLISELISKCDIDMFCSTDFKSVTVSSANTAENLLETNLRDSLLDLEERVFTGMLGSLKVKSRAEWRDAIFASTYDAQCTSLTFGGGQVEDIGSIKPGRVHELAMALLQIEQMVESKYLNPPLGEDEEKKKEKQKAAIEAAFKGLLKGAVVENGESDGQDSDDEKSSQGSVAVEATVENQSFKQPQHTPVERWELSLMSSTSLSQVAVHLSVLDNSIVWSKSSLHARCRICRRKGDGERMLLCDACDRGHHMYCLKPPVKHVPEGDWFCPSCRPKEMVHVPRTPRKSFTNIASSDESDVDQQEDQNAVDELSDVEMKDDAEISENATDTEAYGNTTEDDVSTVSQLTRASAANGRDCSLSRTNGRENEPARGRGRRFVDETQTAENCLLSSGTTSKRPRRSGIISTMAGAGTSDRATNGRHAARHSLDDAHRRKPAAEWKDYEVDSRRLSLSTKSRSGEAEHSMKMGHDLVADLMRHDDAWPFLRPVTKKEASDYFDIIKHPMDFATIRNKLNRFEYDSMEDIYADIQLIFTNCATYNLPQSLVAIAGKQLKQYFEQQVKKLKSSGLSTDQAVAKSQRSTGRKRTL